MLILQRVAMTIYESFPVFASDRRTSWSAMSEEDKAPFVIAAKKVLGAMRAPSHQMLADGNQPKAPADAGNVWERMIFRALYEE